MQNCSHGKKPDCRVKIANNCNNTNIENMGVI